MTFEIRAPDGLFTISPDELLPYPVGSLQHINSTDNSSPKNSRFHDVTILRMSE